MKAKRVVRLMRKVREDRAREHASRRDWDAWMNACTSIRELDEVLEEFGSPGYVDPLQRIPFSEEFARKFAQLQADDRRGLPS